MNVFDDARAQEVEDRDRERRQAQANAKADTLALDELGVNRAIAVDVFGMENATEVEDINGDVFAFEGMLGSRIQVYRSNHWTYSYDRAISLFRTAHAQIDRFLSETEYEIYARYTNDALETVLGCPDLVYAMAEATPLQLARAFLLGWRWHQADMGNEPEDYDHLDPAR